jgi:hypothetical protein
MKCPSCGRENPETAIRCAHCRAELHDSIDDRTMDSPGQSGLTHGDAKPSFAPSDFKDTLVRTPSGHSHSHIRKAAFPEAPVVALVSWEPGDELGPRFQIDELLGEGGMAVCTRPRTAISAGWRRSRFSAAVAMRLKV